MLLVVTNQWRMMQRRSQWAKTQSRRPGESTTKGFSTLSDGTQTTCLMNHQWKTRPSQSPSIWLRRLSLRRKRAKHLAHQALQWRWYQQPMICDLAAAIIVDGKVPSNWEQSFIVSLYKGKGYALESGNYRCLKLTQQVMKVLERIVDIRCQSTIPRLASSQSEALEVSSCQQETLHFCRPGEGVWSNASEVHLWGLRKFGVEWIVRLVQWMYANVRSCVHVGEGYSEEFEVKVGVHQGSLLSPLHFITVLETLSHEFSSGVICEDLYADDLIIIAELLKECVGRLLERSNRGERIK